MAPPKWHIPRNKWKYGIYSEEYLEKIRKSHLWQWQWNKWLKRSEETKKRIWDMSRWRKYTRKINEKKWLKWDKNPNRQWWTTKIRWELMGSIEYTLWRRAVFERDYYRCRRCWDDIWGNLNAHHVKARKDYPELRFAIDNWLTLCEKCHKFIHYWK